MGLSKGQMDIVIKFLNGSYFSVNSILNRLYGNSVSDMSEENFQQLNDQLFECSECGIWRGHDEKSYDKVCTHCTDPKKYIKKEDFVNGAKKVY